MTLIPEGISFASQEETSTLDEDFSFASVTEAPIKIDKERAGIRAEKYAFGLGVLDDNEQVGTIFDSVQEGSETMLRQQKAFEHDIERRQIRHDLVNQVSRRAVQEGRPLSADEKQEIRDLTSTEVARTDPNTFFERKYAEKVVDVSTTNGEDGAYRDSIKEDPVATEFDSDAVVENITKIEGYHRLNDQAEADSKNQGWLGWTSDALFTMIPGYSTAKIWGALEEAKSPSWLAGNNLAETVQFIHNKTDPEESIALATRAYNELKEDNQLIAHMFASALLNYSNSKRIFDNVTITGVDFATAPGVKLAVVGAAGATALTGRGAYQASQNALSRAVSRRKPNPTEILDAAGMVDEAADATALEMIARDIKTKNANGNVTDFREIWGELLTLTDPATLMGGSATPTGRAMALHLADSLRSFSDDVIQAAITNPLKGARFEDSQIQRAFTEARERFFTEKNNISDKVLDIENDFGGKNFDAPFIRVTIGTEGGDVFGEHGQALNAAIQGYGFHRNDVTIVPRSGGYAIQLGRPIDITTEGVRKSLRVDIKSDPTQTSNLLGQALLSLRTGDEVLPKHIIRALKRTTYGATGLEKALRTGFKEIGKLRKESKKDFLDFLNHQKLQKNPNNPEKLGRFSDSIGTFEHDFFTFAGKQPSEDQITAYFNYKAINDIQYGVQNLGMYVDKVTSGHMLHEIEGLTGVLEGKISTIDAIKAARADSDHNVRVLFMDERGPRLVYASDFNRLDPTDADSPKLWDYILGRLQKEQDFNVVELSPEGSRLMADIPELADLNKVGLGAQFAITRGLKSRNLPYQQIPYQQGGHHITPDGYFISQAKIGNHRDISTYYGDVNIFRSNSRQTAEQVAKHLDEARKLYKASRDAVRSKSGHAGILRQKYIRYVKDNLAFSHKRLTKEFKSGRLSPDVAILARTSNKTLDVEHNLSATEGVLPKLRVHRETPYNTYRGNVNLQFAQEKGERIMQVVNKGDAENPIFGVRKTDYIDSIEAMDRSLSGLTRGRDFETLRRDAATRFVTEFEDVLDMTLFNATNDPFLALRDATFKAERGVNSDRIRLAKTYQARVLQFLDVSRTPDQKFYEWFMDKTLSNIDADLAGRHTLSLSKALHGLKPSSAIKSATFNATIGLFNIRQLLQQAQTLTHIQAIAGPATGTQAAGVALVQNIIMAHPDKLIGEGGRLVKALGLDPKDFVEMTQALRRTGFDKVGREVATRDQQAKVRAVPTTLSKIAESGLVFFNTSEAFVRRTAWNAAYKEWKKANPGLKPTDKQLDVILNRADDFNVNMSQASNANWQRGALSITTQFLAYPMRLAEQVLGKRLSNADRARLMATYSAAYGIPQTLNVGSVVWPLSDEWKETSLEWGIEDDIDSNVLLKVLHEGVYDTFLSMGLGEDVNFSDNMGPMALTWFKDLRDGRKNIYDILAGPSGNVVFKTLEDIMPVFPWIYNAVHPSVDAVPPTVKDFTDVVTNISSLGQVERMFIAYNTGSYVNKYGAVTDVNADSWKDFFILGLGLQRESIGNMYDMRGNEKRIQEFKSLQRNRIKREIRNMIQADDKEDTGMREVYYRRARSISVIAGFNELDYGSIVSEVMQENESLLLQTMQKYVQRKFKEDPSTLPGNEQQLKELYEKSLR